MPRGEILALTLDRVAVDFATIRVERHLSRASRTGKPVFAMPKTPSSTDTIPIGQVVLDEIRQHVRDFAHHGSGPLLTTDMGNLVGTVWAQ